jgi:hypothetical protein
MTMVCGVKLPPPPPPPPDVSSVTMVLPSTSSTAGPGLPAKSVTWFHIKRG